MRKKDKLLLTALVIGALGSLGALGVFGAFSATTQNAGNEIVTGTVVFGDNDSGSALYSLSGANPGDAHFRCIKASYTGSLDVSEVHLYSPSPPGPLAQYIDLTVTQGSQATSTFPDCTGFTPDAVGVIYTGTLRNFEQTHNTYANGIDTDPVGQTGWNTNDSLVYRFQVTVASNAPDTAQATSTGVHSYVWEAQSD
jgi:hypothetical protein